MEQKKVTKKNKRKMTPLLKLICFVLIGVSAYLFYRVGKEIYTTVELTKQLNVAKEKFQKVKDESTYLSSEKEKLQDPNYVQSYARGNYMLSKEGEQIFYLPGKEEK